jgi:hypothetical protein
MIFELTKKLEELDSSLSLKVSTEGNITCLEVVNDIIGTMYSFSSTDRLEVYTKVLRYIDCLEDCEKFEELLKEVMEIPLEV